MQLAGLLKTGNGISARVAAPSVHFVTAHAALVSCWPLPQRLLPVSPQAAVVAVARNVGRVPKHPTHESSLFYFEVPGRSAKVLLLGGGCVQDHLHAGLAAQSSVDGQIIVVGITPAVLGVVVVVGRTVAVGLFHLVLDALFVLGLDQSIDL